MKSIDRFRITPTTITEAKFSIYAPYNKIKNEIKEDFTIYEDKNIKIKATGYQLTQVHKDILDIICYYGNSDLEKLVKRKLETPLRFFSMYSIQKHLNHKYKNNNRWIEKKLEEIKNTTIKIKKKNGDWIHFNIIDIIQFSKKFNMYAIMLNKAYMIYFENEISIGYKEYLDDILNLKHASSKALARYLLTHSNDISISLDKLLIKIGIKNVSQKTIKYHIKNIMEDKERLKKLNITFIENSKNIITEYKKLDKIKIYFPTKKG